MVSQAHFGSNDANEISRVRLCRHACVYEKLHSIELVASHVDLQQRSHRRSKHSSRSRPASVPVWSPLFFARVVGVLMIVACPWKEGAANWSEQYPLVLGSLVLAGLLGITLLEPLWKATTPRNSTVPSLSICFLAVAAFAWFQSVPIFSIDGNGWAPSTVQIQRWFLGYPNQDLDTRFAASKVNSPPETLESSDESATNRLAISVEPLHTRAAVTGLVMVALMIWLGAIGFYELRWQLFALIALTLHGVAMGILGLAFVLSWNQQNIFGGGASYSFATFVSKNSAGGFLNICLAASLGVAAWAFANPRQKEQRYAYVGESPALRFIRGIEDGFAQLTTPQIASMIATAFLLACVLITGSRGAAISGFVACILILLIGRFDSHPVGRWIFSSIVVAIGLGVIVGFQLDDRVVERLSTLSLSEIDSTASYDGRLYVWQVALDAFSYLWMTGGGLGTFHFSHLPFQKINSANWFYHAESLYLQALVDLGWVGGVLIICTIYFSVKSVRRICSKLPNSKPPTKEIRQTFGPIYVMGLALIVGQLLHSFVDFALILPSLFLPASLLLGILIGAARERSKFDLKAVASTYEELKSTHSSRSSSTRVSRIKVTQDLPAPTAPTPDTSNGRGRVIGVTCVLSAILFLYVGIEPLQHLARAEKMESWLKKQNRELPQNRDPNPSSFLAGLWGRTGNTILEAPDAMRMIAESLVYEFQLVRMKELEEESGMSRQAASDNSAAFAVRLGMTGKQEELEKLPTPKDFDIDQRRLFLGSNEQLLRWEKSLGLIREAQKLCPLDHRLIWDRLVLDYEIDLRKWNGWLDRSRILNLNKPNRLFQLGLIARRAAGDNTKSEALWSDAFKLSTYRVAAAATVLAADTPDESIPIDIFPSDPAILNQLLISPFEPTRFPKTNARLWERIESAAEQLSVDHTHRAVWLAAVASKKGDKELELQYLEEAVRVNPLNRIVRLQWVDRLSQAGQLTLALQQAEFCLSLVPDDVNAEALVKRLKEQMKENTSLE
jgi:O-Antigen ligase